jgi:hypothetical protein
VPISSSNFSNNSSLDNFTSPKPTVSITRYFVPSCSNSLSTALQTLVREELSSLNSSDLLSTLAKVDLPLPILPIMIMFLISTIINNFGNLNIITIYTRKT